MEYFVGLDRSSQWFLICSNFHQKNRFHVSWRTLPPLSHWQIYSGYSFYSLRYCIIKLLCVEFSFNLTSTSTARDVKVSTVLIYLNSYGCWGVCNFGESEFQPQWQTRGLGESHRPSACWPLTLNFKGTYLSRLSFLTQYETPTLRFTLWLIDFASTTLK